MLRCAASFGHCGVLMAYLVVRLTPQDLRALPANTKLSGGSFIAIRCNDWLGMFFNRQFR